MDLDLVHHGFDGARVEHPLKLMGVEVGDADAFGET